MEELLRVYREITEQIFTSFGIENGYGEIDEQISVRWNSNEESIYWIGEDDEVYVNDIIRGPAVFENYSLFYVDNGCGYRYYQIFKNDLIDENIEDA
jgi:hypothetical protein